MNLHTIISQVFILFAIILVGFIAKRTKILNDETDKGFNNFLLNIAIPFTVLSSFDQTFPKGTLHTAIMLFIITICIYVFSILFGYLLYHKFEESTKKVLWFGTVFANTAFMGYPIAQSLYGKIGVFYTAIYNVSFNLFVWTFGQMLFTGKKDKETIKRVLLNPSMIATFIGMILFFSPYKLIAPVGKFIDIIGNVTTPISMIIVGSMLARIKFKELFSGLHVYYGVIMRLVVVPLITLVVLKLLGVQGILLGICIILTAMPVGSFTAIFAKQYGCGELMASKMVFISTALSIVSIPLIAMLV